MRKPKYSAREFCKIKGLNVGWASRLEIATEGKAKERTLEGWENILREVKKKPG